MSAKSIFITGAASGIGKETARTFSAEGWRVGLCDRDAAGVEALAAELGGTGSAHVADVTDIEALGRAMQDFCGEAKRLDVLFNCAGILEMRRISETPLERQHAIVDVNIKGVLNGIHLALPFLRRSDDARIVTMSSVAAVYGIPEEAVYSSSKFAVRGLTEALNIELEPDGIWVSDVMVAYVNTPMATAADHVAGSVGILGVNVTPDQVAATVLASVRDRQVHWFVTEADSAVAKQVDGLPWAERRALVQSITGF